MTVVSRRRPAAFTFEASEFYDRPLVVVNSGPYTSFVDLGVNRVALGAGEEKSFDVQRGADYLIGLGPCIRLVSTGQEVLKR